MAAPISIQLYTLRAEAKKGLPGVIERLGRIGYVGVEPAGLQGLSPAEFRRLTDAAGLRIGREVNLSSLWLESRLMRTRVSGYLRIGLGRHDWHGSSLRRNRMSRAVGRQAASFSLQLTIHRH